MTNWKRIGRIPGNNDPRSGRYGAAETRFVWSVRFDVQQLARHYSHEGSSWTSYEYPPLPQAVLPLPSMDSSRDPSSVVGQSRVSDRCGRPPRDVAASAGYVLSHVFRNPVLPKSPHECSTDVNHHVNVKSRFPRDAVASLRFGTVGGDSCFHPPRLSLPALVT